MAGFGDKLREVREQKGFSLEMVEEETKIRKLYLEALEKEAFSILPARVYATGFVKQYAQFLGLDPEEIVKEFKDLAYSHMEEEEPPVIRERTITAPKLPKLHMKNLFFAIGFLLLAIWAGNFVIDYIGREISKNDTVKPPVTNNTPKPSPQDPSVEPPASSQTLDMVIKVKPDQKCWVLVRVDGEEKLQGILNAGKEQSFQAKESIYIKVGNAGGIDISLNNKKQQPLGGIGEVKEKEYTNGGKTTE